MLSRGMPDSRATIDSASSAVSRCWASKSAGTYSASITGVIGITLSRRTLPCQVCANVAAVAIAGLARSVSARSIGTSIDLNISRLLRARSTLRAGRRELSIVGTELQKPGADEADQPAAAERHIVPRLGVDVDDGQSRGRHVARQLLARGCISVAGQGQRELVHAGVVAHQQ